MAVLEDLQKVAALSVLQGGEGEVVEDQQVHLGQPREQPSIGAVGFRDGQIVEEPRGSSVVSLEADAAGALGQGAGEPALADSGGTGDQDILVVADVAAGSQSEDLLTVEASRSLPIDVFERGRLPEPGDLEAAGDLAVLPGKYSASIIMPTRFSKARGKKAGS